MSEIKDGGPAFPVLTRDPWDRLAATQEPGMSLRDWFAGQALSGLFAGKAQELLDIREEESLETIEGRASETDSIVAEIAYRVADAMLIERSKP